MSVSASERLPFGTATSRRRGFLDRANLFRPRLVIPGSDHRPGAARRELSVSRIPAGGQPDRTNSPRRARSEITGCAGSGSSFWRSAGDADVDAAVAGASGRLWASSASRSRESTWRGCRAKVASRSYSIAVSGDLGAVASSRRRASRSSVQRPKRTPARGGAAAGAAPPRPGAARSAPAPAARAARRAWPGSRRHRRRGRASRLGTSPAAVSIRMPTRLPALRAAGARSRSRPRPAC